MGGRGGSSGVPGQTPTKARDIENMNEAQLNIEIGKAKRSLASATRQRAAASASASASNADMREAFPLGTAGLSRSAANKISGRLSEQSVSIGGKLSAAMEKQQSAEKRIQLLQSAKDRVKGTGKTLKELRQGNSASGKSTMKWSTAQKESYSGGALKPRIIKSGSYEIRGSSVLRVYHNGQQIGTASSLATAKSIAEKHKNR